MGKKIIYDGQYIRCIKEDGWEYVERNNCTGIVIIISKTAENKVLFVEQYRLPVKAKCIEFPAGLMNDEAHVHDESAVEAAKRELLEETGYQAESMRLLVEGPVSAGLSANSVMFLMAEKLTKVGHGGGVEGENIKVHEIFVGEADQWLAQMSCKGYCIDPKVYAGLYFLKGCHRK